MRLFAPFGSPWHITVSFRSRKRRQTGDPRSSRRVIMGSGGNRSTTCPWIGSVMEATMSDFFPGFQQRQIEISRAKINLVTGGSGPPLLLLHGYPQTHVMWRKVALRLAQDFTVVVPDLRGYGDS